MSIPLNRLYYYIENISKQIYGDPIVIYRFDPNGSKKLEDLTQLRYYTWSDLTLLPTLICNDQEPLDFNFYKNYQSIYSNNTFVDLLKTLDIMSPEKNFKTYEIFDKSLVVHSEKRSRNLKKYQQNQHITIYYWSHALLALDWFRYAKHTLIQKNPKKMFLIYNRAWSGTREYRLKFADQLVDNDLVMHCQTSLSFIDQNTYYKNHKFFNSDWQPMNQLENYFNNNTTASTSSADFCIEDYENTEIEIVLETLFDDDRLHLTEKSLRPIACGQPFILAATHGSLEYLRSYGFKTFDGIINENYDQIEDPVERLHAITVLMTQIANWTVKEKHHKITQMQRIADYNRRHFFSNKFFNQIETELKTNLLLAFTEFENTKTCNQWITHWEKLLLNQAMTDFLETNQNQDYPTKSQFELVYKEAKKYIK